MTDDGLVAPLQLCQLFHGLTLEERKQIEELMTIEHHPAGTTVIEEGGDSQSVWLIVRGVCTVARCNHAGQCKNLATLEPGSVFGEMSFLHSAPHSASIRTEAATVLWRLTRERFERLHMHQPRIAYIVLSNLVTVLAQRLRKMDDWVCNIMEKNASPGPHHDEWTEFRARLFGDWNLA